jgi:hypothetical protein
MRTNRRISPSYHSPLVRYSIGVALIEEVRVVVEARPAPNGTHREVVSEATGGDDENAPRPPDVLGLPDASLAAPGVPNTAVDMQRRRR